MLIFTQYADTARYLSAQLNPGGKRDDIDVIYSGDKDKIRLVGRFAPKANPEYRRPANESELHMVIATDVLAEGLNLQDCHVLINYDLHWNPVRLIQRFGRIDRIGSEHDVVHALNFLPETGLEKQLGLRQKLHQRIQEIHDTIGEDAAILDRAEQLNERAMYAIYEQQAGQLSFFEDEVEPESLDLTEAEEILRQLRKDRPEEYQRIAALPDGIRTSRATGQRGIVACCVAGTYRQLFLADAEGMILSRDLPRVLGMLKCGPEEQGQPLPEGYNRAVMRVRHAFAEEVKHRQAEREHTLALTQGQRYVLRELRLFFSETDDEDVRAQINLIERAYRGRITGALNRQLNGLRRDGLRGHALFHALTHLYGQHNLGALPTQQSHAEEQPIPQVMCSEALV